MKRMLTLAAVIAAMLPLSAQADTTTTFTAPYDDVTTGHSTSSDGTPMTRAVAVATADAATGAAHVSVEASDGALVRVPLSQSAQATGSVLFRLPAVATGGNFRGVATFIVGGTANARSFVGSASASIDVSVGCRSFCSLTGTNFSSPYQNVVTASSGLLMSEQGATVDPHRVTIEFQRDLFFSGDCQPLDLGLDIRVEGSASASQAAEAGGIGDVTLESVTIEQLPCPPQEG